MSRSIPVFRQVFRRLFRAVLSAYVLPTACCLLPTVRAGEETARVTLPSKPNIVFLLIDDMGWPDLACYGHPFHETPQCE